MNMDSVALKNELSELEALTFELEVVVVPDSSTMLVSADGCSTSSCTSTCSCSSTST
jgi:hypothetical protein